MNMFKKLEKKFSAWLFSWQKPTPKYLAKKVDVKKKENKKDQKEEKKSATV